MAGLLQISQDELHVVSGVGSRPPFPQHHTVDGWVGGVGSVGLISGHSDFWKMLSHDNTTRTKEFIQGIKEQLVPEEEPRRGESQLVAARSLS